MDDDGLGWHELIGFMYQVREKLSVVKPDVYPLTLPNPGATGTKLAAFGDSLDAQYRDFLGYADGWAEFFRDVYLLGTGDLAGGPAVDAGERLLDGYFRRAEVPADFPEKKDLIPIAVGTEDIDVFVLWRTGPVTEGGHPVLWLADEEIDRFANFREFFLSIHEHLKRSLAEGP
ncbi:hypothetical protein GCM10027445_64680 [Amycolatopsis endophytica]|uniref:SMI1/KNR4 family protein n=1 Tax=Amycolatopsis endophytica TaxID=860233 RepID=A0A853B5M5_9PSEU|nr:hypothetical protein [Amycolatopsis endophytica]NYI89856.1 hypothetical protein [Amycolatopsis endophytica]